MLYVFSCNIRPGRFAEFESWVAQRNKGFQSLQPKSWKLKDVYLTAFGLGPAHVEVHWEIDNYQALDIARETAQQKGPFFEFLNELHSHLDPSTVQGRLLKSVTAGEALIVGC